MSRGFKQFGALFDVTFLAFPAFGNKITLGTVFGRKISLDQETGMVPLENRDIDLKQRTIQEKLIHIPL